MGPAKTKGRSLRTARYSLELLEPRRLLSTNFDRAVVISLPMTPLPDALQDKIEPQLWSVLSDPTAPNVQPLVQTGQARFNSHRRIQLYIHALHDPASIEPSLLKLGITPQTDDHQHIVQAWVPTDRVDDVAQIPGVSFVGLPHYGILNAGTVSSAGDSITRADLVRSRFATYGIDGSGIKIGVMSDGVNHLAGSQASGDLPQDITIEPGFAGSGDEGTAMLEVVHDLAPGAQLYFAGVSSATDIDNANSIDWFVSQGCNVIVDDFSFVYQPYFSDGIIAQAAANATAAGVTYVTAAGNYATKHWQGSYVPGTSGFNDFGGGDIGQTITIAPLGTFYCWLQWSDPFGASSNDYDLWATYPNGQVIYKSQTRQTGTQDPLEWMYLHNTNTTTSATVEFRVLKAGGANRELEMFGYTIGSPNSSFQFQTPGDALIAQEAVPDVISVAAASAATPTLVESFSSDGGSTIYDDFATQTKSVRQTLDGTSIDGVQTYVGQTGYFSNPFNGTSAAAPHVAAIAALMRQANPSLTPAQVAQALADTAQDLTAYGAGYDVVSGAGLYNALDAVYKVFTPDAPGIASGEITSNTTPGFTGTAPAGSYVRLFIDGIEANAIQLGADQTSYSLAPTTAVLDGTHAASVRVSSSASIALANASNPSAPLSFTIDTTAPAISSAQFQYLTSESIAIVFSEDVGDSLDAAGLLVQDSMGQPVATSLAYDAATDTAVFSFPDGLLADGDYTATLPANSVTDRAGNPLASEMAIPFFVLAGDANHDRSVDVTDLGVLATNWQGSDKTFADGDFNYDGVVDVTDLGILATNWQQSISSASTPAAMTSLSLHHPAKRENRLVEAVLE